MKPHYLEPLFSPKHIAVIGASDRSGSPGQRVLTNLLGGGFQGKITPVNPKHKTVGGLKSYAKVDQIPEPVDVAIVLTRISSFEQVFNECSKAKIRYLILLTAQTVTEEERKKLGNIISKGQRKGLRILGPSYLGLIRTPARLNASTHTQTKVHDGNIALVCQSSSLTSAILDWAHSRKIGFSTAIALGDSSLDIDFGEILDYLANDKSTGGILIQIHHIRSGRKLMSALKMAARVKPVVVIKSGRDTRTPSGQLNQTSQHPDSDAVFRSALARAGVLQVNTISHMFTAVKILAANYRAKGNRLAVICNGIGLGQLAADTAHDIHVPLVNLSPDTLAALNDALPEDWSHDNPVDILGDAGPMRFRTAAQLCLDDPNVDGVLVIFSPQANTEHLETAQMMVQLQQTTQKPLLVSWLGGDKVQESRHHFAEHKQLQFNAPEYAVEAFASLARYYHNQQLLLQTASPLSHKWVAPDFQAAHQLLAHAREQAMTVLPESMVARLLGIFQILTVPTRLAHDLAEAKAIAAELGYPIALKIDSPDIFYKSDVGGVILDIRDEAALENAYNQLLERVMVMKPEAHVYGVTVQPMMRQKFAREVMISVNQDTVFGPIISFGAGGVESSVQKDRAIALPPLNEMLTDNLIRHTRIYKTFGQFKNMPPIDEASLRDVLLRVSEMVCELPEIKALEIDPLLVSPQGVIALNARVILGHYSPNTRRYKHMAIMPYPSYMESRTQLKDGTQVLIRPSRPEDAEEIQEFVRRLSDQSRYNRFMSSIKELSQAILVKFTQLDYDREMALSMIKEHPESRDETLGIARYMTDPDMEACEFAISIADAWQGQGIGTILMERLFEVAREQGLKVMRGEILTSNAGMQKLTRKLGFTVEKDPDDPSICLVYKDLST